MRVTVLNEIPEDPDLSEAWNTLVLEMDQPEVFFTYQWALAAGRGFKNNLSPWLFLMYEADKLIGVAALAVNPSAPRAAFFLTASTADYCDVVSAPSNRKAVILALLAEVQNLGVSDLVFANVPSNSPTLKALPEVAGPSRYYVTSRDAYNCGVVQLEGEEQRESLLRALGTKSRDRRALKKLTAMGAVKVIHLTEPEQIGTSLESIVSAQISRFLASDRVSPLVGAERRTFLRQLSTLLSHSGWLKISQLEIDGEPVAWNYGFLFGGSWFWYLPTFQMKYEHVSPGSCLLRLLVEESAKDASVQRLDLGLGDESYKDRYANNVKHTRYVRLSQGLPRYVLAAGREMITSTVSRFPELGDALRRIRSLVQAAAGRLHEIGIGATLRQSGKKIVRVIASQEEVLLFNAPALQASAPLMQLIPLTREHLVEASILHAGDANTIRYLMRCSRRMNEPGACGFVLPDQEGKPVHFLWVNEYDGFHLSEIDHKLEPLSKPAAMIFDCWTPASERGRGHYASAIREAAADLRRQGKGSWIFSAASNSSSLRGIQRAGFEYRFSLLRRRKFGRSTITRLETSAAIPDPLPPRIAPQSFSKTARDVARGNS